MKLFAIMMNIQQTGGLKPCRNATRTLKEMDRTVQCFEAGMTGKMFKKADLEVPSQVIEFP